VERAIRAAVCEGDVLATPARSEPFRVGRISATGIILELGEKRTPTLFSWPCMEGIVSFLTEHGRVPINGSGKSTSVVPGTLDGYLKAHVNRLTAGWVAALLEKSGVVVIDRNRRAYVRLCKSL
jgi:hypothetical protein